MSRYLMCEYGAARVVERPPEHAEAIAAVTVGPRERYRILRCGKELLAVSIPPLDVYGG